jgi:hypothetical protein
MRRSGERQSCHRASLETPDKSADLRGGTQDEDFLRRGKRHCG